MNLAKSREYFQPETVPARIHIIGCGAIGSVLAENLVRFGITNITLWDFDIVEDHNIANQLYTANDIGKPKAEALAAHLKEINPDIGSDLKIKPEGWDGDRLSGFVFLCVDSMKIRQRITQENMSNTTIRAMFDFRMALEDAQHYAANWRNPDDVENFWNGMDFTDEEAKAQTPVSACNMTLSVCPTVRSIVAAGVANFINYLRGKDLKRLILVNAFNFSIIAL